MLIMCRVCSGFCLRAQRWVSQVIWRAPAEGLHEGGRGGAATQTLTSPGDRAGTGRSPESLSQGAGAIPPSQAQQHRAICHPQLLPAAGVVGDGAGRTCLCMAQCTRAWGKALQHEQGTAIHRTVPDCSLLGPFMVMAESGQDMAEVSALSCPRTLPWLHVGAVPGRKGLRHARSRLERRVFPYCTINHEKFFLLSCMKQNLAGRSDHRDWLHALRQKRSHIWLRNALRASPCVCAGAERQCWARQENPVGFGPQPLM